MRKNHYKTQKHFNHKNELSKNLINFPIYANFIEIAKQWSTDIFTNQIDGMDTKCMSINVKKKHHKNFTFSPLSYNMKVIVTTNLDLNLK